MTFYKNLLFLALALVAVNFIFAEEAEKEKDDRKFRFPFNHVTIGFHRAGEAQQVPGEDGHRAQERLLFGLLPNLVRCNYTAEPGRRCVSCTESLLCLANNLGLKRDCGPLYCRDGHCSFTPSPNCTSSSD